MNIYKKYTEKPYSFLITDSTLVAANLFTFHKKSFRNNVKINYGD